jgi:hypothetical protein
MRYCSKIIWKGHPSQDYFSPKGALQLFWLCAIYVLCMQRPAILLLLLPEVPRHLMLCESSGTFSFYDQFFVFLRIYIDSKEYLSFR